MKKSKFHVLVANIVFLAKRMLVFQTYLNCTTIYMFFGTEEVSKNIYRSYIEKQKDASLCIECGKCETICPQNIKIAKHLKEANEILTK